MAINRIARCACGDCSIALAGEPKASCICHCSDCKRRTGSVFGVSNYFRAADLGAIAGELAVYGFHHAEEHDDEKRYFCKKCGTPLYWQSSNRPQVVGVAAGCFPEESLAIPSVSYSTSKQLAWVELPENCKALVRPPRVKGA